ncbi:energy transducer TonB [Methylophilus aquaticus]|uniref:TonB family protein n=1 Tax=Methylophilus aquaticus TaxID=1971610 RepID=A0ABT9JTQ5_9PROT|nr:energy transducer TonB [Methylophilus aquaticus]MDP8567945.1 TonB family protein [Methylophilus aquaticus]
MRELLRRSPLMLALWLSLLVHVVVLTLHFQPELKKFKDQIPALEVMLVNSKTSKAPEKADALAQANLDRGGNTDEKRQMKSPRPSVQQVPTEPATTPQVSLQPPAASSGQVSEIEHEKQRVAQLEQQALALMTQLKKQPSVPTLQTPANQRAPHTPSATEQPSTAHAQSAAMQEMAKLEALIAQQQEIYEMRPKRQFIGARTKEYRFASYVEQWRQQVERVGNLNYPQAAKAQKLYGQLQMTVSIKADGSIEEVRIQHSSGHKLLDESARRIVQLAAPFPVFTPEMRKDTDILSITRTWAFTQEDSLQTQ